MIKKIIRKYFSNMLPESIVRQFAAWYLDGNDTEEKEEALLAEWNAIDPAEDSPLSEHESRKNLKDLERRLNFKGRNNTIKWLSIAAAAVLLMTGEFFIVHRLSERETVHYVASGYEKSNFRLPDGSAVCLNAGSRLSYSQEDWDSGMRNVSIEGEAVFDVVRNEKKPFNVRLNDLNVKVLGTRFLAMNDIEAHLEQVTLQRGNIEVCMCRIDSSLVLRPDERLTYDSARKTVNVDRVNAASECDWDGGKLRFINAPLSEIVTSLEHWYNIDITIADNVDEDIALSFVLRSETLPEAFHILELLSGVDCEVTVPGKAVIKK